MLKAICLLLVVQTIDLSSGQLFITQNRFKDADEGLPPFFRAETFPRITRPPITKFFKPFAGLDEDDFFKGNPFMNNPFFNRFKDDASKEMTNEDPLKTMMSMFFPTKEFTDFGKEIGKELKDKQKDPESDFSFDFKVKNENGETNKKERKEETATTEMPVDEEHPTLKTHHLAKKIANLLEDLDKRIENFHVDDKSEENDTSVSMASSFENPKPFTFGFMNSFMTVDEADNATTDDIASSESFLTNLFKNKHNDDDNTNSTSQNMDKQSSMSISFVWSMFSEDNETGLPDSDKILPMLANPFHEPPSTIKDWLSEFSDKITGFFSGIFDCFRKNNSTDGKCQCPDEKEHLPTCEMNKEKDKSEDQDGDDDFIIFADEEKTTPQNVDPLEEISIRVNVQNEIDEIRTEALEQGTGVRIIKTSERLGGDDLSKWYDYMLISMIGLTCLVMLFMVCLIICKRKQSDSDVPVSEVYKKKEYV